MPITGFNFTKKRPEDTGYSGTSFTYRTRENISLEEFEAAVREAARKAGLPIESLKITKRRVY